MRFTWARHGATDMKTHWGFSIMAAAILAAGIGMTPAAHARTNIAVAVVIPGAVAFDVSTGGYCDRWGCPVAYWGYPVWYGPTYCGGVWYNGPVYYQSWNGARYYWVHGGWCPMEWVGPYPAWWSSSFYYGPVLSFTWYESNGFRISSSSYAFYRSQGGATANWTTIANRQFTTAAKQGRIARATTRATSTKGVAKSGRAGISRSQKSTRDVTRGSRSSTKQAVRDRTKRGSGVTRASHRTSGQHRSGPSHELSGPRERSFSPDRGDRGPETRGRPDRGGPGPERGDHERGGHRGGPHG